LFSGPDGSSLIPTALQSEGALVALEGRENETMSDLQAKLFWARGAGQASTAILHCSGEIDLSNIVILERALAGGIATDAPVLEVDLRKVSFLDSSTVEALLHAHHTLIGEGRALCLHAGPMARRLFRLVGAATLLKKTSLTAVLGSATRAARASLPAPSAARRLDALLER
jgi:anti-anti-sigma factor